MCIYHFLWPPQLFNSDSTLCSAIKSHLLLPADTHALSKSNYYTNFCASGSDKSINDYR